ncbi:hypothetical protein BY996DRAFT_6506984 [Phakopsora pachyrhizi]|nr:hypothetical protein BY996DRAFT_6506984 [Phakopsora pachyrhizi]
MISKFVTCLLSNITIRLQTTASSSSRALVDQSQSRSRTPLQKPNNKSQENHNNGQADDNEEEVTSNRRKRRTKDTGGFSSEVCTRPRATATA